MPPPSPDTALPNQTNLQLADQLRLLQKACITISGAIALVVLCGWLVPAIGSHLPQGWSLMKANTALATLLSLTSFTLAQTLNRYCLHASRMAACIIMLLAVTALLGHLSGRNFSLDTLLAADSSADMPGRMSIQSASFFLIMGITLIFDTQTIEENRKAWQRHIVDILSLTMIAIVLVIIAGYIFRASELFGQSSYTLTSPQTLICFVLLSIVIVIHRTRSGVFSLFVTASLGSQIARRAVPFALLIPFLIVGGGVYLTKADLLSAPYSTALISSVMSSMLMILVMLMAWKINDTMATLAETEQQNRLLLDAAGKGIYGVNAQGIITFANPAACRMSGYELDELIGNPLHDRIHHHHADGSVYSTEDCPITMALKNGKIHREEDEVFWRKDGSRYPVVYNSTPLQKNGKLVGAVVIFNDISERKKLERLKDEFVATVTHELRTPLTSIKGSLGLVVGKQLGEIPEPALSMLGIAYENSTRLELLINDLLDINRIQLAETNIQMTPIWINALVSKAVEANQGYAEKYTVKCVWRAEDYPDVCVLGNESRLMQVLSNLLSNAFKYSPKNLQVVISTSRKNDKIRVSVTDKGPGIPLQFQPKLFEKFSRADASDTREKEGTGLGLAISKEIIQKHGGEIGFVSGPEQGSTFYFELPQHKMS